MIRNVAGIFFLIVSGFFVYMVCLLAFLDIPDVGDKKYFIIGVVGIVLVIFHLVGIALYRGANWKVSTGVTLFIGAAFNILVIITMLSIKGSPEVAEAIDVSTLDIFSDYVSGGAVMATMMGVGSMLYLLGRSSNSSKPSTQL